MSSNPRIRKSNPAVCRLPIQHPEYRYGVSKNPYALKLRALEGRAWCDNGIEAFQGQWRAKFLDRDEQTSVRRPLHVELGCNGGHVILEWAAREPRSAYIGIDWKFKQVFRGVDKGMSRGLENLIFLRGNLERIGYMFGPGEIDFLYLYFPDPWEKNSQTKNRFLNAQMLRTLAGLVRPGGVFHIKTDHQVYFDFMLKSIDQSQEFWSVIEQTRQLHPDQAVALRLNLPEVTLFEKVFIRQGLPIYSVRLKRLESLALEGSRDH